MGGEKHRIRRQTDEPRQFKLNGTPVTAIDQPPVTDDFRALLRELNLPAGVEAVRYATGCRIRRVRVKRRARKPRRTGTPAPIVILSRRLLEQVKRQARTA